VIFACVEFWDEVLDLRSRMPGTVILPLPAEGTTLMTASGAAP
jgi:hypothetical protein